MESGSLFIDTVARKYEVNDSSETEDSPLVISSPDTPEDRKVEQTVNMFLFIQSVSRQNHGAVSNGAC